MNKTKIEWCDSTLNPVIGCTFGCPYCYARAMNKRFSYIEDFSKPQFFPERLKQLDSKKTKNIFMDSMSDFADWKREWQETVFEAIKNNPQHRYLILSKRPEELPRTSDIYTGVFNNHSDNIWFGTSVTNQKDLDGRYWPLMQIRSHTFLSIEPLLGHVNLNSIDIGNAILSVAAKKGFYLGGGQNIPSVDWIIIGAETGNRKGKVTPRIEWVHEILAIADIAGIPVFMKDSLLPIVGEKGMRRDFPQGLKEPEENKCYTK